MKVMYEMQDLTARLDDFRIALENYIKTESNADEKDMEKLKQFLETSKELYSESQKIQQEVEKQDKQLESIRLFPYDITNAMDLASDIKDFCNWTDSQFSVEKQDYSDEPRSYSQSYIEDLLSDLSTALNLQLHANGIDLEAGVADVDSHCLKVYSLDEEVGIDEEITGAEDLIRAIYQSVSKEFEREGIKITLEPSDDIASFGTMIADLTEQIANGLGMDSLKEVTINDDENKVRIELENDSLNLKAFIFVAEKRYQEKQEEQG